MMKILTIDRGGQEKAAHRVVGVGDSDPRSNVFAEGMTLGVVFEAVARSHLERTALITPKAEYTFGELLKCAESVGNWLFSVHGQRGLAGERVVIWLPNSFEYIAALYGVLLAGGIAVPLPPDISEERLQQAVGKSEPSYLISRETVLRKRPDWLVGDVEDLDLSEAELRHDWDGRSHERTAHDPAMILFTSGSSGDPKGVTLSHENLLANARSIIAYLEIGAADRALGVLPFYHAFGNSVLQTHLLTGATLVLAGSTLFPESIVEAIREHGVTSLSVVPELAQNLLTRSSLGREPTPLLQTVAVAGGRLAEDLTLELRERVLPARLFIMYGQTEATARLSYLAPEELPTRVGSIGRGIDDVELEVVDEEGRCVGGGALGEIRARGPNVMTGYWEDVEGTSEVLRDDWLYTGDLAIVDGDGFIFPKGRRSGFVKIAGHRVHPREIEAVIRGVFNVLDVRAVAFEKQNVGLRLAVFIQPRDQARPPSVESIMRECASHLPRYQVPDQITILDDLPKTANLKTDIPALQRIAEQLDRERAGV